MSNYQITYSCGHEENKNLVGKGDDRRSYIAWAQRDGLCSDCRKANQDADIAEFEASHEMPAIEGSAKQIAWARKIRHNHGAVVFTMIEKAGQDPKISNDLIEALRVMMRQTKAAYWIDKAYEQTPIVLTGLINRRIKAGKIAEDQSKSVMTQMWHLHATSAA